MVMVKRIEARMRVHAGIVVLCALLAVMLEPEWWGWRALSTLSVALAGVAFGRVRAIHNAVAPYLPRRVR